MAISGSQLVQFAQTLLGSPYVWGGTSPTGFDCSGFVQYVYNQFGLSIPRVTYDQINAGNRVNNVSDAQPGDLIFFSEDGTGSPDHVAMYMGNDRIIVADNPGVPVRIRNLDPNERIVGINRYQGVISTTDPQAGSVSYTIPTGVYGGSGQAALPVSRPTFDWWSGLGISAGSNQAANENVGLVYSFIKNDPDLQNLYSEAVAGSWSQDQFVSALQATDWWKNNSATVRQNLAMKTTDPATWARTVANDQAKVEEMAVKLGVHLTPGALQNITNTAALMGYDDALIQQTLSTYLQQSSQGWFGGYAGQVELGLKEYAADQGIPLSQGYINNAVKQITAGGSSLEAERAKIQTQAAAAFPAYADLINKGMTVGKIAQPYANSISSVLEQNPDHVDLFNPLLRQALQYATPVNPASPNGPKQPAILSLTDFEKTLRQNPAWRATNNARESLMATGNQVLSDLGLQTSDLGSAPQTSPESVTALNKNVQSLGLSGMTAFPTLQGQQALNTPTSPISSTATSLAPSGPSTQGTPQEG